jgi:hypothetical protein
MVLTSFRITLISAPKTTIGKWKSVNLTLPLIYDDKFEKPLFGHNNFQGKCKGVQEELGTILTFKISLTQGTIIPFKNIYKNLISQIRNQQYMNKLNRPFYQSLETGDYQRKIQEFKANDPNYLVYFQQPNSYPGANALTELMEKTLPGLTKLEKEQILPQPDAVVIPHLTPDNAPLLPDGYSTLQDVFPLPEGGNEYPELPQLANELPDGCEFALLAKGATPAFGDELHCGSCGAQFSGSNAVSLKCGHSVHKQCLEK